MLGISIHSRISMLVISIHSLEFGDWGSGLPFIDQKLPNTCMFLTSFWSKKSKKEPLTPVTCLYFQCLVFPFILGSSSGAGARSNQWSTYTYVEHIYNLYRAYTSSRYIQSIYSLYTVHICQKTQYPSKNGPLYGLFT